MDQEAARFATQNKLAEAQLAFDRQRAAGDLQEAAAWAEDAKVLAPYQDAYRSWQNDTNQPIPSPPPVKSRQGIQIVNGLLNQASGYSAQARLAKARDEQQKLEYNLIAKEIEDDNKLIANTGKNFRMYTQSSPRGYERDPALYQEALDINARNQTFRSMSAGETTLLPDEEISRIAGIPIEEVPNFRKQQGSTRIELAKVQAAKDYVDQIEASLGPVSPKERATVTAQYMAGVNALNAPQYIVKDINSQATVTQLLDGVIGDIEQFNARYGKDAFSKFTGPIDSIVVEKFSKNFPSSVRDKAIADAKNIFETVATIVQGYRKGNFGLALTATEVERFMQILRDPNASDYERSIKNFRNNNMRAVQNGLNKYKFAPNIPLEVKETFIGMKPVDTYQGELEAKERAEMEALLRKKSESQPKR